MFVSPLTAKEHSGGIRKRSLLYVLLLLFAAFIANGQESKVFDKVVIGNTRYILHPVQKNETLYSISRLYDCTQEEVLAANNLSGVIKKGMILKIPDHTYQQPTPAAPIDESKFIKYLAVSGDNFYQLKLKFGVDEEELLRINPDLKEGLKAGKIILIPVKSKAEPVVKEAPVHVAPTKEIPLPQKGPGRNLNVGLFLPISAAVTDSLKPTAKTLSFLAFYQGVLLAVDQQVKNGLKIKLFVYDTEKSSSSVETLVKKPEMSSLDLIIGPVYPEVQRAVSELSERNKIPMVSPLSSDDRYTRTNPWFFQVNPVKKLRLETTADYILKEFSKEKIILLAEDNRSSETRLIHDRLNQKLSDHGGVKVQVTTYDIWAKGLEGLESQLIADKPNVLVMAETNEVQVSVAMNRLTLLSKKFPLILIGIQEFTRMPSIEIENLHDVNLRFLTTSYVNYQLPSIIQFADNFRTEFGTEPSSYAFQGYDEATFFLNAMHKTGELGHGTVPDGNSGLLQATYHFTKTSDSGGYTNDAFTVVEYSRSFEIQSFGTMRKAE
jgi:ABC-type branched-subunit amino acid transport system substrate-binding protein